MAAGEAGVIPEVGSPFGLELVDPTDGKTHDWPEGQQFRLWVAACGWVADRESLTTPETIWRGCIRCALAYEPRSVPPHFWRHRSA
jgi:hypothetical protein